MSSSSSTIRKTLSRQSSSDNAAISSDSDSSTTELCDGPDELGLSDDPDEPIPQFESPDSPNMVQTTIVRNGYDDVDTTYRRIASSIDDPLAIPIKPVLIKAGRDNGSKETIMIEDIADDGETDCSNSETRSDGPGGQPGSVSCHPKQPDDETNVFDRGKTSEKLVNGFGDVGNETPRCNGEVDDSIVRVDRGCCLVRGNDLSRKIADYDVMKFRAEDQVRVAENKNQVPITICISDKVVVESAKTKCELREFSSSFLYGTGTGETRKSSSEGFKFYLDEINDDTPMSLFSSSLENDSLNSEPSLETDNKQVITSPKSPEIFSPSTSNETYQPQLKITNYIVDSAEPKKNFIKPADYEINLSSTELPFSPSDSLYSPNKMKMSEPSSSSEAHSPISCNSFNYSTNLNDKNLDVKIGIDVIDPITSPFYPISEPSQETKPVISYNKERADTLNKNANGYNGYDQALIDTNPAQEPNRQFRDKWYSESNITAEPYAPAKCDIYEKETYSLSENGLNRSPYESDYVTYGENGYSTIKNNKTNGTTSVPFSNNFINNTDNYETAYYDQSEKKTPKKYLSLQEELYMAANGLDSNFTSQSLNNLQDNGNSWNGHQRDQFGSRNQEHLSTNYLEDLRNAKNDYEPPLHTSPCNTVTNENRKTYCIKPKIEIAEDSDSILKTVLYNNQQNDNNGSSANCEDEQPKLGVWTKVKPRKYQFNSQRSTDRAKKIIQENSAILQKILTCQAKKRLPELEELREEITISPINEEISKIFSPILEKMGLDEDEINKELAKINLKDFDRRTATTTASEFEAKINEELSKLSLVDDSEYLYSPDSVSVNTEYLNARDEFIDHQMNHELSKVLDDFEDEDIPAPGLLNPHDLGGIYPTRYLTYNSPNNPLDLTCNPIDRRIEPVSLRTVPALLRSNIDSSQFIGNNHVVMNQSNVPIEVPRVPLIYQSQDTPFLTTSQTDFPEVGVPSAKLSSIDSYRALEDQNYYMQKPQLPIPSQMKNQNLTIPYSLELNRNMRMNSSLENLKKSPLQTYSSDNLDLCLAESKHQSPRISPSVPYRSPVKCDTLPFVGNEFRRDVLLSPRIGDSSPSRSGIINSYSSDHVRIPMRSRDDGIPTAGRSIPDLDFKRKSYPMDPIFLSKPTSSYSNLANNIADYQNNADRINAMGYNDYALADHPNYQLSRIIGGHVSSSPNYSTSNNASSDILNNVDRIYRKVSPTAYGAKKILPNSQAILKNDAMARNNGATIPMIPVSSPHCQYYNYISSTAGCNGTAAPIANHQRSPNFEGTSPGSTSTTAAAMMMMQIGKPSFAGHHRVSSSPISNQLVLNQSYGYQSSSSADINQFNSSSKGNDWRVDKGFNESPSPNSLMVTPYHVKSVARMTRELGLKLDPFLPTNCD